MMRNRIIFDAVIILLISISIQLIISINNIPLPIKYVLAFLIIACLFFCELVAAALVGVDTDIPLKVGLGFFAFISYIFSIYGIDNHYSVFIISGSNIALCGGVIVIDLAERYLDGVSSRNRSFPFYLLWVLFIGSLLFGLNEALEYAGIHFYL